MPGLQNGRVSTQRQGLQAVGPHTNVMTTHSIFNQLSHCYLRLSGEASNLL